MRKPQFTQQTARLSLLSLAITVVAACSVMPFMPDSKATAPILNGFGESSLIPTKANTAAQSLFAQGMTQVYGFNGKEAIRAFKAALAQDPHCAMCAWGVAYQMGPIINNPSRGDLTEALQYVDYAMRHSAGSSDRDLALIDSLALRYAHSSVTKEIAPLLGEVCTTQGSQSKKAHPLDVAYAEKIMELVNRFPNDPDILAIYAEAEMVATTDDWWNRKTGKAGGKIGELADRLESALVKFPNHTGLNHYMIHSVDAVQVAHRAEAAADRLGLLAPKSPHLLHMPSHTYAQIGRYADATRVNQIAVAADETMMQELKKQNFNVSLDWRGHNRHFQWYGALMEGRGDLALSTARAAAAHATGQHVYAEYTRSLPMLTLLYLERWDDLKKEAMPSGDQGMANALGEMSRGIAYVKTGQIKDAQAALVRLETSVTQLLKKNASSKTIASLANTAQFQLRAEIALANKQTDEALTQQTKAAEAAYYADGSEPPMLAGAPLRRLGTMQTQEKKFAAAEQSFREDLKERPQNGWALQGLHNALVAQEKTSQAQEVKSALEKSWKLADKGLRTIN